MARLEELDMNRINEVLSGAVEKNVPLTVTVRRGTRWVSLHSRANAIQGEHLWMDAPVQDEETTTEFSPAEKIGVSFKLKHHKHLFSATVVEERTVQNEDGQDVRMLIVCRPLQMQRLQRRAYTRVDVPANRIVRASFWMGGKEKEPSGTSVDQPVWSGAVVNLSAGGFLMKTSGDAAASLDVGDVVGIRMAFGAGSEIFFADAQFRHADARGDSMYLGFQFVGLDQTAGGREALAIITRNLKDFQRAGRHGNSAAG